MIAWPVVVLMLAIGSPGTLRELPVLHREGPVIEGCKPPGPIIPPLPLPKPQPGDPAPPPMDPGCL